MSEHAVNVIEITDIRPHPNADRLECITVSGWQAVVRKGEYRVGDRAVYVEPDYIIPTKHPSFSFLAKPGKDEHRLKAVRLRGELSYGLLIPLPEELRDRRVGENVMQELGIRRWEPPVALRGADELAHELHPKGMTPKFDLENLNKYLDVFSVYDHVIVSEKIDGANARYLFSNGTFFIGSRTRWLKPESDHAWSRAVRQDSRIENWCRRHEGIILYGEVYGPVQSLRYGVPNDQIRFAAFAGFDITTGRYVDSAFIYGDETIPTAPVLYVGHYDEPFIRNLAELDSSVPGAPAGHMREGVVIVSSMEGYDSRIGRRALKHISNRFWESDS